MSTEENSSKQIYSVNVEKGKKKSNFNKDDGGAEVKDKGKAKAYELPKAAHFKSLPEKIAKSDIFKQNWYYPLGWEKFPTEYDLRYTDYYFPYAEGGALALDMVDDDARLPGCKKKAAVLKTMGIRYLILTKGMSYNKAMEALEGA